jgi:hypothetical protein
MTDTATHTSKQARTVPLSSLFDNKKFFMAETPPEATSVFLYNITKLTNSTQQGTKYISTTGMSARFGLKRNNQVLREVDFKPEYQWTKTAEGQWEPDPWSETYTNFVGADKTDSGAPIDGPFEHDMPHPSEIAVYSIGDKSVEELISKGEITVGSQVPIAPSADGA